MTWQMANSLSLMAIGLLLDLFSSDFAIVCNRSPHHPTNYTINRLQSIAIICHHCHRLPRVNTLGWDVSRLRRLFIIFNDRHIINQKLTDFLFFRKLKHIFSYIYVIKSFC